MTLPDGNAKGEERFRVFDPELSSAEFESEFWKRVLERQPYYEDVLRRQAEALAKAGHYQELVPLDRRLLELRPTDPVVHYNLACTLARLAEVMESLQMLKAAIRLGYADFGHIETDPDLDPLRDMPEFKALLRSRRARR
jgi:tetratricopeptide (TPR) repeat protein